MKHLRLFENFEDIDSICREYAIENYTINSDGLVDVDGCVNLSVKNLVKLPVRFGKVTGDFFCPHNQLTSLMGSPRSVGGDFICSYNQLQSLEGGPKEVGGFYCYYNQLTTLMGSPRSVGGDFICSYNKLRSLEGGPSEVGRDFYCDNNKLTTLVGSPREVGRDFSCEANQLRSLEGGPKEVGGDFNCNSNPIWNICRLFNNYQEYMASQDYNYLRGTDIVKSRFEEALQEIGKTVPKKITGYNYI